MLTKKKSQNVDLIVTTQSNSVKSRLGLDWV